MMSPLRHTQLTLTKLKGRKSLHDLQYMWCRNFIHECLKQVQMSTTTRLAAPEEHKSPCNNFKHFCYLAFNAVINFILFYLLTVLFDFATLRTELRMRTELLARPPNNIFVKFFLSAFLIEKNIFIIAFLNILVLENIDYLDFHHNNRFISEKLPWSLLLVTEKLSFVLSHNTNCSAMMWFYLKLRVILQITHRTKTSAWV